MLTELQKKAIDIAHYKINSVKGSIIRHKYKSNALKSKLGEIRSQSEEHRTDPLLLELHDLIWHLMDELEESPLQEACEWLYNLDK